MPARGAPLAGLRILSVEQFGAGPFGSLYLADLGAEVIKIEDPGAGGDVARYIPPGQIGTDSLYFEAFNRGKKSIVLDLKASAGRNVFDRLVCTADAVYSNLRGDQADHLGITYGCLSALNPRLVCVTLTGYGRHDAGSALPSYDALVQAESGWATLTGEPGGPPTKSGLSLVDYATGLTAALALLAGVIEARRTGVGRDLDTNLYDSALAMLSYQAAWYLSAGHSVPRRSWSAHPSITPFQFFRTADGHIAVACPKEKFFRALVAELGLPGLAEDARFGSFAARDANRDELLAILEARFGVLATEVWLRRLRGVVPIAPVRSLEEALDLGEVIQRGMLVEYEHPALGTVRSVGLPIDIKEFKPEHRRAPQLGEHGQTLLCELGYDDDAIAQLAAEGAFGNGEAGGLARSAV